MVLEKLRQTGPIPFREGAVFHEGEGEGEGEGGSMYPWIPPAGPAQAQFSGL